MVYVRRGMTHIRAQLNRNLAPLEKGQIWMLKNECLEVKHVGKYLAEFSITRKPVAMTVQKHIRVSKQLESIKTVLKFLHSHKAVLRRGVRR